MCLWCTNSSLWCEARMEGSNKKRSIHKVTSLTACYLIGDKSSQGLLHWCVLLEPSQIKHFVSLLSLLTTPQAHLHSKGDGEIWRVKFGAGWQREWAVAFVFEWNRLLVQVEGNERDLTVIGHWLESLAGRIVTRERAYVQSVCLCDRLMVEKVYVHDN